MINVRLKILQCLIKYELRTTTSLHHKDENDKQIIQSDNFIFESDYKYGIQTIKKMIDGNSWTFDTYNSTQINMTIARASGKYLKKEQKATDRLNALKNFAQQIERINKKYSEQRNKDIHILQNTSCLGVDESTKLDQMNNRYTKSRTQSHHLFGDIVKLLHIELDQTKKLTKKEPDKNYPCKSTFCTDHLEISFDIEKYILYVYESKANKESNNDNTKPIIQFACESDLIDGSLNALFFSLLNACKDYYHNNNNVKNPKLKQARLHITEKLANSLGSR